MFADDNTQMEMIAEKHKDTTFYTKRNK